MRLLVPRLYVVYGWIWLVLWYESTKDLAASKKIGIEELLWVHWHCGAWQNVRVDAEEGNFYTILLLWVLGKSVYNTYVAEEEEELET